MIYNYEAVSIHNQQEVVRFRFLRSGFNEVISELIYYTFSDTDAGLVNLISYQSGIYVAK